MDLSQNISVIIPVFNRSNTLLRALRSVLAQTYQEFEILVIDDGSSPPLAELLPDKLDSRIRWIRLEENGGPGRARNIGLQHAKGNFVAFLDSDDEWLPHKLERQIAALQAPDEPFEFDAVASGFYIVRKAQKPHAMEVVIPETIGADSGQVVWGCRISPGSTLVARKSLFDRVGTFREDLRRLEDWEWLLRIASHQNILVLPEPLAIIHFSAPPDYIHVADGCSAIHRLQGKKMRDRSWLWYLKFRSTLELEKASAALHAGRILPAIGFGLTCLIFWPFRNMLFWSRVFRQLGMQTMRLRGQ